LAAAWLVAFPGALTGTPPGGPDPGKPLAGLTNVGALPIAAGAGADGVPQSGADVAVAGATAGAGALVKDDVGADGTGGDTC